MWTPDAYVRFIPLPLEVEGVTTPNPDGSCDIYINCLLCVEKQREALLHEVGHVVKDHLFDDEKSLEDKEKEADEYDGFENCDLKFCG